MHKKMKWLRSFFLSFVFILLFHGENFSSPRADSPAPHWITSVNHGITIFYTLPDSGQAQQTRFFLQETNPGLQNALKLSAPITGTIYIAPNMLIFKKLIGPAIPEWSEAICLPNRNIIIMKSLHWSPSRRSFKATVIHEVVHLAIAQKLKNRPLPTWLNEGLAVYFSGERALTSSTLVARAAVTNSLIPLKDIQHVLRFQKDKAGLAYQESYLAVQFIIDNYGIQAIASLLNGFKNQNSVDATFSATLGLSFVEFEQKWLEHIQRQNRWDDTINFNNFVWFLMGALFIIAVLSVWFRNRKKRRDWEEEEEEEEELL